MQLYGYWRSSAAYRVRIVMHLKGVEFESIPVHLVKDGGQQHSESFGDLNPNHLVPTLVDGELVLNQSLAIIEYLDRKYPNKPVIPSELNLQAQVRALAYDVACEIHPINNLRVQQYLEKDLSVSADEKLEWSHHWMSKGFAAIERKLAKTSNNFCFGNDVTLADICLVPQVYNANRFNVDMVPYPRINQIVDNCNHLSAFKKALPENQPDAQ